MTWVIGSPGLPANPVITGTLTVGGQILAADGTEALPAYSFTNDPDSGIWRVGANRLGFGVGANLVFDLQTNRLQFYTGSVLAWGTDLVLLRDAANILALRNGTNAQQFNVYNTFTDASNYERLELLWTSNQLQLKTVGLGSGNNARPILIMAGSGGTGAIDIRGSQVTIKNSSGTNLFHFDADVGMRAGSGNYNIWNGISALATTATAGFLGVNSCAGPPTGVPASIPTGQIPLVWDSTNLKLYAYTGGAWKSSAAFA